MTDAVIVSTARTGLAKSWRGSLNMSHPVSYTGHVLQHAIERARLDPAEVEDVIVGATFLEGASGANVARQVGLRAGCPVTTAGLSINRFCSSGLQTIALAAQRVLAGEGEIFAAGGLESISCVQNEANTRMLKEDWVVQHKPEVYWNMLQTAETVAKRYGIARQAQDEYGVESQLRAAAAQEAGRFQAEIVPFTTTMAVADKNAGTIGTAQVTLSADEGIRPDTTYEGVAKIRPALPGGVGRGLEPDFFVRIVLVRDQRHHIVSPLKEQIEALVAHFAVTENQNFHGGLSHCQAPPAPRAERSAVVFG